VQVSATSHRSSPHGASSSTWVAPRPRPRSRCGAPVALTAWWRSWELDRRLAAGADPRSDPLLQARARLITGRRSRKRVAEGLAGALAKSRQQPTFTAAVRPNGREVVAARTVLATLGCRLRSSEPVAARGVAILLVLLCDCTSPLFAPGEPGALGSGLRAAAAALEPVERRPRADDLDPVRDGARP
jgi:hypothetical protein